MTRFIISLREDDSPQFSLDGQKIAFASSRSGSMEIWGCDINGGNSVQLTHHWRRAAGSPRWSPDSRRLVFDAKPEMHTDLFMIDADGGKSRRLTSGPSEDILPSWSRDGAWIYFCSDQSGDRQIWKMPAEGGEAVQVTSKGGFEAVESPDGQTLYYSKTNAAGLWATPTAGGEERAVPELAEPASRAPGQ